MEEESQRLKRKSLWIAIRDSNSNFCHNYASYRHNVKSIWDTNSLDGEHFFDQRNIEKEMTNLFSNHFKYFGLTSIGNQMRVVRHYPSFSSKKEGMEIGKPISLEEAEGALK